MSYGINMHYGLHAQGCAPVNNFVNFFPRNAHNYQPRYDFFSMPQPRFGVVGGAQYYMPPPAISYATAYSCFTPSNMGYGNTLGVLSAAVSGILYSTPMAGGNAPGQLSTYGSSMPYTAWCPPGGGYQPNHFYSQPPHFSAMNSYPPPQYKSMSMGW